MNSFICQSILYLFAHQCELDETGNIVAKTGFSFKELYSREKIVFEEKSSSQDGNIFYNQTMTVLNRNSDNSVLKDLTGSHLILKLSKLNGSSVRWGSLEPYNPVQVEINTKSGTAEISFFRQSPFTEY